MIDGKTRTDILAMPRSSRSRWYQTLSFVDRGIVMETVETARQAKQSEYMKGENNPMRRPEVRAKMTGENNPMYGKSPSEATRAKQSAANSGENNPFFGKTHSEITRAKMRGENNPAKRPEVRAKLRAAKSGENNPNFNNWSSRAPYCHLWTEEVRESIRNRDERRCQSCGKSEILNGRRLSVHHIDGDKMNSDLSNLTTLCRSCNVRPDTLEKEFLIVSNLNLRKEGT